MYNIHVKIQYVITFSWDTRPSLDVSKKLIVDDRKRTDDFYTVQLKLLPIAFQEMEYNDSWKIKIKSI